MNESYIFKYDEKIHKWYKITLEDNDEIIQSYNKKRLIPVNNNNTTGMYGFIAESSSKNPRSRVINNYTDVNYNRTMDTIERINAYMTAEDYMLEMKFKINDKSSETQIKTHLGATSKKSYKIGLNCIQNATTSGKAMLHKLKILFADLYKEKIMYKNEIVNETIFKIIKNLSVCDQIALSLKILDIVKYKNVRWFLSPYDTEYFIPSKYNINIIKE